MNRIGMMVDLSHASDQTFYDAVETSKAPIVNSHAACRRIANHPRNLTDDMLKALARNGGVLGVAYYGGMLDDEYRARFPQLEAINRRRREVTEQFRNDKKRLSQELWTLNLEEVKTIGQPALSRLVDHIEHAATVAGIDHVGLGSDFDSIGLKLPEGLEDIGKTPNLIAAMKARGFTAEQIRKIMGANALRVMQKVEAAAGSA
jgi:membrane dipeptidase